MAELQAQYGPVKGKQVFYSMKATGKITGVDRSRGKK